MDLLSFCFASLHSQAFRFACALLISACSILCCAEKSSTDTEPFTLGFPEPNSKLFKLPRINTNFTATFQIFLEDQYTGSNTIVFRFNSSDRYQGGKGVIYSELKLTREDCAVTSTASLMTQNSEGIYSYYDFKYKPSVLESVRVGVEQLSHEKKIYRYRVLVGDEYTEFQMKKPLQELEIHSPVGAIKVTEVVGEELK